MVDLKVPALVFVNYHGVAVYADGEKVDYVGIDEAASGYALARVVARLCQAPLEVITVRWEDMPGAGSNRPASEYAPKTLADLSQHLAEVAEKRRQERITQLRAELARLEAES